MNWAYVAGVFDGEGTVGVYHVKREETAARGYADYHAARLTIVGTHRPMIEAIYKFANVGHFGIQKRQTLHTSPQQGKKYSVDGREETRLCKQGWKFSITSKYELEPFLLNIVEFLHEKRRQVEIVLAFFRKDISGADAVQACKAAKKFHFPATDWVEPPRRIPNFKGEKNPFAKLSHEQVRELRARAAAGATNEELMRDYNIDDRSTIWRIKTRRAYAGVN